MTTLDTLAKSKALGMQQPIEKDFRDDDENAGVGVDAAIAGDQADVFRAEPPADRAGLHLVKLLLGQGDERRGVVGDRAGVQGFEECRLSDQRLARSCGSADHDALLCGEP